MVRTVLPLQIGTVQSLVQDLRSCKPKSTAKKKKDRLKKDSMERNFAQEHMDPDAAHT